MGKALVVYATRKGDTRIIGEWIAEGVRFGGHEVKISDVSEIKQESDLNGYEAYLFGSPTYHGEIMQTMKTMLFLAEKANLAGKIGGSFGAFGWSGEASQRIYDTMKHILSMDMVSDPLRLKSPSLGGATQMAQEYGRSMARKMGGD